MRALVIGRRAICLVAAASVIPPRHSVADEAAALLVGAMRVATLDFSIGLPSSCVRLSQGGMGGRDVLLVAGDYRSTIRETGAATCSRYNALVGGRSLFLPIQTLTWHLLQPQRSFGCVTPNRAFRLDAHRGFCHPR